MSEEPTIPMKKPQRLQHGDRFPDETDLDEQKTVVSDQESTTPPARRSPLPMGDQGVWPQPTADPGFVRTVPSQGSTPPPFASYQHPAGREDQTMAIGERPTPVFAWLVILEGPDRNAIGTVHTLHPETTTIGRAAGSQIVLGDETVSSQHARIRLEVSEEEGPVYVLFDMGSRNGVFVGNQETYKNHESRVYRHRLRDGDYVLIGETTLVFKRL